MVTYKILQDLSLYENALKLFFKSVPFGRFLSDPKINLNSAVEHEYNALLKYMERGSIALAINHKNNIMGLIGFHFSEWDTDVFQKRMAIIQYFLVKEIEVEAEQEISTGLINLFHKWSKENKIDVVVTKLDSKYFTPILMLQKNGYLFYECITYRKLEVAKDHYKKSNDILFRYAKESDKEQLKKFALKNTFKKSHFYLDTNFDLSKVEIMYSKWIENALNSKQKIVIIEESDQIAGVFIYDIADYTSLFNKKFGVWKFAAVDSNFRDRGIGTKLFMATLQSSVDNGAEIIDSTLAEKNIISQKFHDKLGFYLVNTVYTLHKWF